MKKSERTLAMIRNDYKLRSLMILAILSQATFDGITISIEVNKTLRKFSISPMDWHIASSFLDELHTKKILEVTGHKTDGMTQYKMKEDE